MIGVNNNNVGIGTTSPGSKLDVAGTAQLRGSAGGTGLCVNSSGNVGIGTTEPGARLDVNGVVRAKKLEFLTLLVDVIIHKESRRDNFTIFLDRMDGIIRISKDPVDPGYPVRKVRRRRLS